MEPRVHTPSDGLQIDLYNDKSLNRSPRVNWVEARGGLPPNVRARARAICRKNPSWSLSRCIATAINANKYSESADDTFFPGEQHQRRPKRAGHIKVNRQWEALKGKKKVNMANTPVKDPKKEAMKEKDPKKRAKLLAALKKKQAAAGGSGKTTTKGNLNFAKQQNGKEGAASDGNRSKGSLAKTIAAYKRKKAKMSSSQRKKVEARIKSSQQQLG